MEVLILISLPGNEEGIKMDSPNKAARIAGLLYLLSLPLAMFPEMFVRQRLIVPGDAAATASNIMANELLFRFGIMSDIIMLTLLFLWRCFYIGYSNQLTKPMLCFSWY